jgi:hypothetical protein
LDNHSRHTQHGVVHNLTLEITMSTRRSFLQLGLAAVALRRVTPVTLRHAEFESADERRPVVVPDDAYAVLADERFVDSVAFAAMAERLGHRTVRFRGDVTDFWFNDLSVRWKNGPATICGVTEHGPLFCLERFAWDHGMRVTRLEWNGPLASWVIA